MSSRDGDPLILDKPQKAFAALQRKFESLTKDDIETLEGKLNRITQERNEFYASLISRLNTSFVKFKKRLRFEVQWQPTAGCKRR
ncbi:hypothetical protein SARC_06022 [Sphaeroforma arctica JP610]|uniref:Uncharacterized protein n=1 Tax=Sphaeroforma arctica JP610 TaxID=667725 RepID=A0A0L0G0D9_9EUKA|nr:hypothetical protein SARC_06022 [Sphaeroforma arctica JP610]KNC81668.1 hypothetical protein SARC_06022 [Sphaeroforma arctica JP610]|eukprot:XP_014155570.1 hypothetical protein SARC_06022 [Sphaeroforma arctica JP610]